ncbi:nuclease-related domain-containing protein [Trichococcus shcherbakoviae]|uniref:NERD domain-containing protein n=1 Tax=Trichococcus shcherbakoviae subsp. psychrophilus TaxID=2585775 RepID=A0A5C5E5F1_9LACT|nr:nuclease-related domain-containing protein [Trichococcus shcherbakoviae]TNV68438.1 NERD domain-containing protein [Trichococcus shcherbakoviae subsp. psychrophilus]
MEILFFFFLLFLFRFLAQKHYNKSGYKDASGHSYFETMTDPGRKGEYLTYRDLESLGDQHKLLTNVYLPKGDGTTTEIDLIMISETGIYVFESKNYSGWIFGDEDSRNWTQSLKGGKKFRFYNPIWQNKKHISHLKNHLGLGSEVFRSYIIFSERCELKKMSVRSPEVKVMNRNVLTREINQDLTSLANRLTIFEINQIYNELSRYTLADAQTKQAHIDAMSWKK